ncbi:MAG: hypothetical protein U9N72_10375 [Bacteroidota bacterium]|nr:hypothetical protein [Bacteroidota bacterium]
MNHLKITLLVSPYGWAILIFATFAICSVVALLTGFELFWILSFLSGLLLLVAIDTAHAKSDKRNFIRYHNAQVFLTGLLLASYLVSEPLAFIFISAIKTMYILLFKLSREGRIFEKGYSLLYICYLAFISYSLFTSLPENHFAVFFTLLLIFELGMRIIFYFDLNPAERNKNIQ